MLWCEVLNIFGVQWVMPLTVTSLLFRWRNWFGKHFSEIWNVVPSCLMWLVSQKKKKKKMFNVVSVEGMQFPHV